MILLDIVIALGLLKAVAKISSVTCKTKECLVGKTAIVTGIKDQTAAVVAANLVARGAKVIVTDSDAVFPEEAFKEHEGKPYAYKTMNFASFKSVRAFAEDMKQNEQSVDILILPFFNEVVPKFTEDGLPLMLQAHHFGPFLLIHLLQDLLKKSTMSRIVLLGTVLSFMNNLRDPMRIHLPSTTMVPIRRKLIDYANAKVLSMATAQVFAQRFRPYGITCNSVFPGIPNTFGRNMPLGSIKKVEVAVGVKHSLYQTLVFGLTSFYGKTHWENAQTVLYVATAQELANVSGHNFMECTNFIIPKIAMNETFRETAFLHSEHIVKLTEAERIK